MVLIAILFCGEITMPII